MQTRPPASQRVVQFASGNADSALNDSVYDGTSDTLLRFDARGAGPRLSTMEGGFGVWWCAPIHVPDESAVVIEVARNYYRERWVPFFTPVNRDRCPAPPTGWMSWNVYFDTAGEEENLAEARVGRSSSKPFGLRSGTSNRGRTTARSCP